MENHTKYLFIKNFKEALDKGSLLCYNRRKCRKEEKYMDVIVTILTFLALCLILNTILLMITWKSPVRMLTTVSDEFVFLPTVTDTDLSEEARATFLRWGFWGIGFMVGEFDGFEE